MNIIGSGYADFFYQKGQILMKKFLALVFSILCISCIALPVFADGEAVTSDAVVSEGVSSDEIIVNYAAGHEDIGALNLDVLFWSVCGVLILGCLIIFVYKFIQWRNSR